MKLHNTLTKQIDDFTPADGKLARIYSCGPTVYNHAHIGNLSAYIYADILRRIINLTGYKTKHVMNFTDVDDKTIHDSKVDYPNDTPEQALSKLTAKYEKIFLDEMKQVGNDTDSIKFVKATANIAKMQALILRLLEQGIAYLADDGIYFSISEYAKARKYGQLSYINPEDISHERINNDEYDKGEVRDFALWKKQKPGEPAWEFRVPALFSTDKQPSEPADWIDYTGRPGWHIECSVMSTDNLGQPFDIHTGGVDLIFPHHENEIAQSTAGDQPTQYARFFVHNEHLLVNGAKMSKSAHNFYTLPDIIERGYSGLDFRMLILQSHYRSASNFSWDNLAAAKNRLANWRRVVELRWQAPTHSATADNGANEASAAVAKVKEDIQNAAAALENDLDTPNALKYIDQAFNSISTDNSLIEQLSEIINFVDTYLGLNLAATTPDITDSQKQLIAERLTARQNKDWSTSDRLRDQLLEQGIALKDTPDRTIWSRK